MTLRRGFLVLAAGLLSGLLLVASAAGTTADRSPKVRHLQVPVEALAIDGSRIAYGVGSKRGKVDDRVLVWNVGTGKTTTVSGKHTMHAGDTGTGSGIFQLAIAGTRVAWLVNLGGNTEGDDYLFTSSVTKPKERQVAMEQRLGDTCAGRQADCAGSWLGGLVGSGSEIAFNRWTTDDSGSVVDGELDVLSGTTTKSVASGILTVQAASADSGRVAAFEPHSDVNVYSVAGKFLAAVSVAGMEQAALGGTNLLVLTATRKLVIVDLRNGEIRKTFAVHASAKQPAGNLDVQGNTAIYTTGPSLHAINLSSGKDRVIGTLRGGVAFARIGSAGVVYSTGRFRTKGTLVFLPLARVAAAVGR
jgi:hypothetical protein